MPVSYTHLEAVNGFFPQDFRHFFEGGFLLAAQEKGGVAVADYGIRVDYLTVAKPVKGNL